MWSPGTTPIGAIYNKKVFEDAGVDEPPKTWTEFLAACEKIKKAGKIPIALGNQTPWVTQLIPYAIAPATAFAEDPNLAQDMLDGKKTFTNSGWDDGLRALPRAREEAATSTTEPERHDLRAADGDGRPTARRRWRSR